LTQSIRRGQHWWHRRQDGGWLLWLDASETWVPVDGSPPPPAPPARVVPPAAERAPATPVPVAANGSQAVGAPVGPPSSEPTPVAAARPAASPVPAPAVTTPSNGGSAVALQARPEADSDGGAPGDTAQLHATAYENGASPLPQASVPGPVRANAEIYSRSKTSLLARFETKSLSVLGGVLAVVLVFGLTYFGATMVFRPAGDAPSGQKNLPAQKAFLTDIDKMCSKASRSTSGLPPPGNPKAMASHTRDAISTQRKLVARMNGVDVPKKRKALFRAIITESKVQIDHMRDFVGAARRGDEAGAAAAFTRMAKSEKRIDRMNAKYGFKECS
jgi:hypothetical protein